MREQVTARLEELRREFEAGQAKLSQLEIEEARLRETLLRISGAIQVLGELLATEPSGEDTALPQAGRDSGRAQG